MRYFIAFIAALLFGIGLAVSGMTDPNKVIGFLSLFDAWDPALILVMAGAIAFHGVSYFFITKRNSPLLSDRFLIPSTKHLDRRLVIGSIVFGLGWGIAGYCPGPALASLVTLSPQIFIFVAAMIAGIGFYHYIFKPLFLGE